MGELFSYLARKLRDPELAADLNAGDLCVVSGPVRDMPDDARPRNARFGSTRSEESVRADRPRR